MAWRLTETLTSLRDMADKPPATMARISADGRITLASKVLAEAHLGPGDVLRVTGAGDGRILLEREADPLDQFIGSLPGLEKATNLQALRDEWER